MFTAKTELCTGLALRVKTASSIMQDNLCLKSLLTRTMGVQGGCTHTHVSIPIAIPECINAKSTLFPLVSLDSVPVRQD